MEIKQAFEILEISPDATYEEAKAAYRLMAQVWHPDKHHHNENLHAKATIKFKEINSAWREIQEYFENEHSRKAESKEKELREQYEKEKREKSAADQADYESIQKDDQNKNASFDQYTNLTETNSIEISAVPLSVVFVIVIYILLTYFAHPLAILLFGHVYLLIINAVLSYNIGKLLAEYTVKRINLNISTKCRKTVMAWVIAVIALFSANLANVAEYIYPREYTFEYYLNKSFNENKTSGTPLTQKPQTQNNTVTFVVKNSCKDVLSIQYRFFDITNKLVWPSSEKVYTIDQLQTPNVHELACTTNALICFGATTYLGSLTRYWGVGINNDQSASTDSCVSCNSSAEKYINIISSDNNQ